MTNYYLNPSRTSLTATWFVDPEVAVGRTINLPGELRAPLLVTAAMTALSQALWAEMYAPSVWDQPTDRIYGALRNSELVNYLAGDGDAVMLTDTGDPVGRFATMLRDYLIEETVQMRYVFLVEATIEVEAWEFARHGDFRGRARQALPAVFRPYGARCSGPTYYGEADPNDDTNKRPSFNNSPAS